MTLRVNRSYPTGYTPAIAGDLADTSSRDVITLINDAPRTAQVGTIVVDTATNDATYTFTVDGVTLTVTADSSTDKIEIAAAIAAAINNDPLVSGKVLAESDGVDTVGLTARIAGQSFTASDADANLTTTQASTANDVADPVGFGLAVIRDGSRGDQYGMLASAANMTAKVIVLTPSAENTTLYQVLVTVDGVTYPAQFTSDASGTVQEIVEGLAAAINAAVPTNTVAATEDDTTLILTAEVAGLDFSVGHGANIALTSETNRSFEELFAGVAKRDLGYEVEDDGYPAGSSMSVVHDGRVTVSTEDAVAQTDDVYVRLSGSGTIGGFRGSAATGCVRIPRRLARWHESLSSTLAVLEVRAEG